MSLGGLRDDFTVRARAAFRLLCRQISQALSLRGANNQQFPGAGAGLRQDCCFPKWLKGLQN